MKSAGIILEVSSFQTFLLDWTSDGECLAEHCHLFPPCQIHFVLICWAAVSLISAPVSAHSHCHTVYITVDSSDINVLMLVLVMSGKEVINNCQIHCFENVTAQAGISPEICMKVHSYIVMSQRSTCSYSRSTQAVSRGLILLHFIIIC